jgi:hypothetical protein
MPWTNRVNYEWRDQLFYHCHITHQVSMTVVAVATAALKTNIAPVAI